MTAKIHISDPKTGIKAEVADGIESNGLVVATRPLKTYENKVQFFVNETYGINMNIDAAAGGTPINIHDGLDNVYWTASAIIGTDWDFQDPAANRTGTYGISGTSLDQGDTAQFAKGSDQDLTGYSSVTIWIQVVTGWGIGDSVEFAGWDTAGGVVIGQSVDLGDYITIGDTGVWQQIVIPLGDLNLTNSTIDSFRLEYSIRSGAKVSFYMDDLQIEETGTSVEYFVRPKKGTWLHVSNMLVSVADEFDGTLVAGTMPNLPWDSILGVSELSSGIRWQKIINNEVKSAFILTKLMDAMELPSASIVNYGDDGTDVWFTLNFQFTEPVILKSKDDDHLRITLNDNLSGLKQLRASLGCKEEIR